MTLSIGERRTVTMRAVEDFDFRALLKRSPAAAIQQVTGHAVEVPVEVHEEGEDWSFVLVDPASIERELPAALTTRAAIENYVYDLIRDDPSLGAEAASSPHAFMQNRVGFDVAADQAVIVRREGPGTLVLVIPNPDTIDQLDDNMLDLVAGGGQTGSNNPQATMDSRAKEGGPSNGG